jgi:carbonic anhydrase
LAGIGACALAVLAFAACKKSEGHGAPAAASAHGSAHPMASGSGAPHAAPAHGEAHGEAAAGSTKYSVPFAWEASPDEPLAKIRAYLGEVIGANRRYSAEHPPEFFEAFRATQTPRATVVMCSDSRVQTTALDDTPENDAFVIRDIGNQIATAEGSVEYGIRHLHTPLLLILGHTGCGAVKAALNPSHALEPAILRELGTLVVKGGGSGKSDPHGAKEQGADAHAPGAHGAPAASGAHAAPSASGAPAGMDPDMPEWHAEHLSPDDKRWLYGVIINVNAQVSHALEKYVREVEEDRLVVVGAVYDFRNDMGLGPGKVVVVNVNGNVDAKRISAFNRAIAGANAAAPSETATARESAPKKRSAPPPARAEVGAIPPGVTRALSVLGEDHAETH